MVLDSYALLAFLGKERGWQRVQQLLMDATDGKVELHISVINLAEVRYTILRRRKEATKLLAAIESLPLVTASADTYIADVVLLKSRYAVSLADCFAAALAQDMQCPVLTGDPEFHKLESAVNVDWL